MNRIILQAPKALSSKYWYHQTCASKQFNISFCSCEKSGLYQKCEELHVYLINSLLKLLYISLNILLQYAKV